MTLADPNAHKDKFRKNCIIEPPSRLDAADLRGKWKPGFLTHKVRAGESIGSIARFYGSKGTGPQGLDWKMVSRFNWGVDRPPYINWCLVEAYDFDESKNLTKDHKNYHFKGGEEVLIPLAAGAPKPGRIAPNSDNRLDRRKTEVNAVHGPSLMTPGIKSVFKVTGYNVPGDDVTDDTRSRVRWKIKDLDDGSESEAAAQGESIELSFPAAKLGHRIRVHPYLEESHDAIYCECRIIKVTLNHIVNMDDVDDGEIRPGDPINKIHNPSAVVIGAKTKESAAQFRLTKVEPEPPDFVLAPNDEGFVWRVKGSDEEHPSPGEARFATIDKALQNTGSDCLVYGVKPGRVVLEGWTAEAVEPCCKLTLKVVQQRDIPFRVNLLSSVDSGAGPSATDATRPRVEKMIHSANLHLRQIGLGLVADSDATTFPIGGGGGMGETITATAGHAGYFSISDVPLQYVEVADADDLEAASVINARPGVITFNFAVSGDEPASDLGIAPSASYNLHATKFTGPDETVKPDDDANYKDIELFDTPDTPSGAKNLAGILIYNLGIPNTDDARSNTELGATEAHEVGHCAGLQHRDTGDDGLPEDTKNLMHADESRVADLDLLQLEAFRGWGLAARQPGGLSVRALLSASKKVSGAHDEVKTVRVEVKRKGKRVADAYLKYWLKPYKTTNIAVDSVDGWDQTTRTVKNGLVTFKIKLTGNSGDKGTLFILAGDNDDLISTEIDCEVT
jgi:hypothetical protein